MPENPQHPVWNYKVISDAAAAWGIVAANLNQAVQFSVTDPKLLGFGPVDRGSLLRIAVATENNTEAISRLANSVSRLAKELKEMMGFWKQLRADYMRDKFPEGQ